MGRNSIETILGGVVLIVAGVFLFFAVNVAQVKAVTGYELQAEFTKLGGLTAGSDVRINGIKIGTVVARDLDPEEFTAFVTLSIRDDIQLPSDTSAFITAEGILGGMYIGLKPGRADDFLKPGDKIKKTERFKSLEDQVGEIIFLATGGSQ